MQQRYEAVCKFCYLATKNNYQVLSPIVHWHPIAVKYGLPRDADFWRRWNSRVLRASTTLWALTIEGYKESIGLNREIAIAKALSIYWCYMNPNTFD